LCPSLFQLTDGIISICSALPRLANGETFPIHHQGILNVLRKSFEISDVGEIKKKKKRESSAAARV
jgi:hypothetical protein